MLFDGTKAASFIPILYNAIKSAGLSTGIAVMPKAGPIKPPTLSRLLLPAQINILPVLLPTIRPKAHRLLTLI
jgi:hypothetical protein